jgi:5'-deoxynucleotidase YfbR-like HD superfamily hydrolase
MSKFMDLYNAGAVKRYHTHMTIKDQDLAAHSWGVAMIVDHIAPGRPEIILAALKHDLHEAVLGDIPYTAKRRYQAVADVEEPVCKDYQDAHNYDTTLTSGAHAIFKWADMCECYLWARREVGMGNQHMQGVVNTAWRSLSQRAAPTPQAEQFLKEIA